ncbi:unnamed protein product (macronuclear) [Paramecium tetraurelia]|uniref:Chromosome undetermined scaffold_1, whole genome shotgun sequence n=1 Tax=Paramecium tetraurelia TaxID=5888 RepID=Q6BFF9_PARTE|nr:Zn-carboxypeptidase [Paramecium tetraurelia strain d4-2]XP_001423028.1 uncharacterized protein GSPATT00000065001 [Paramecium tetraurelia]CAH03612.1 Zn-carboxypeptidase, putative [Paramecium tetraurelia]CAK55630.1 unnamed protein product [Paramecium tetraurelia]|eukprot:XP_001423028.1 hypothetical protein (macronuclear) [Paramecium tetraurelia strain d4-2]
MILKQCSSREGFDSSNDIDQQDLEQSIKKSKTVQNNVEGNNTFENKPMIQESKKQCRFLNLDVPKAMTNNKTIYLSQPFYNTKQIHMLINNTEEQQDFEIQIPKIYRPFVGMIKQGMKFDSNFESGNLDRVDQISNDEYNLYMRIDTNSIGHSNWFYFKITQNEQRKVKFNICNFTKPQSLYIKGMKPYVLSEKSKIKYFTQQGDNIKYQQQGQYFILSFAYYFEYENDEVSFATLPPYTYSQLINKIKKWSKSSKQYFTKLKISNTLSGLVLPLIIITDKSIDKNKKIIILTARVHPSETCSSYMIQGFISFLLGESFMAQYLRKNIIFKIIPMLNPDGVIVGNYRNGLSGVDLNRQFQEADLTLLPEVKALKCLIEDNQQKLIGYFDFHGHQVRKNIFMYCPTLSSETKIIPLILQQRLDSFRFRSCEFGIPKFKMGTARAYANQFIESICYTIEASFCGYQKGKNVRFMSCDWVKSGFCIAETIFLYLNMKQQHQKQLKSNQLLKKINEMSLKVEQTEVKHDSDDENNSQSDAEIFEDYDKEKLNELQNQMKKELSHQNLIEQGDAIFKHMKVQSVSRRIKATPLYLLTKKDQPRPSLYPDLSIQNWEFRSKNANSNESRNLIQKRGRTNSKLLQSFRFENKQRASSHLSGSPFNQTIEQINITQIIPKKTIYNFPILDNMQQSIGTPLPFIRKLLNGKSKRLPG